MLAAEANISLILPQQGYPFVELGDRDIALDLATTTGDYTLPVEPGPLGSFGDIVTEGDLAFVADHVAIIARLEHRGSHVRPKVEDRRQENDRARARVQVGPMCRSTEVSED